MTNAKKIMAGRVLPRGGTRLEASLVHHGMALASLLVALAACNSEADAVPPSPSPDVANADRASADGDGGVPADTPATPAGDVGASCSGGCVGADLCTVSSTSCASGHCLFDGLSAYCTADCTNTVCPSGFTCKDVPFALTRACVRDVGKARVKGTVTVSGALGPAAGTASPYTTTQTFDTAPSLTVSSGAPALPCGGVRIAHGRAGEPGLFLFFRGCANDVSFDVTLDVPLKQGTFPDSPTSRFPKMLVIPENANGKDVAYVTGTPPVGITLDVTDLADGVSNESGTRVGKLVANVSGVVPANGVCKPAVCATYSDTVTVTASVEITNVLLPR